MLKWNRRYILEVSTVDGGILTIDSAIAGLTLDFEITREKLSSVQSSNLKIYNLNQDHRNNLFKDEYDAASSGKRTVKLHAGYGDNPPLILNSNILSCTSYRQSGSTDFITEIHTFDAPKAFNFAKSNWTMSSPEYVLPIKQGDVIQRLVNDLIGQEPNLSVGVIAPINPDGTLIYNTLYPRAQTRSGNTWKLLMEETNHNGSIVDGKIYLLREGDVLQPDGNIFVISAATGLLSTPQKRQNYLTAEMLFEPSIKLYQQVQLDSESANMYSTVKNKSGQVDPYYIVIGYNHTGTISGAVSSRCTTTVTLNSGIIEYNPQLMSFQKTLVALGK